VLLADIASTGFSGAESAQNQDRRRRGHLRSGPNRLVRHRGSKVDGRHAYYCSRR
jgi:hypothetical protein